VLGYFIVADVWPEVEHFQSRRVTHYKVKLEFFHLNQTAWWAPAQNPTADTFQPGEVQCERRTCSQCNVRSKTIFQQGWVCLNMTCGDYYKINVEPEDLTYSETFLGERVPRNLSQQLPPLAPPLPSQAALNNSADFGIEAKYKRGIVCPRCGCCNPRTFWKGWICENAACAAEYDLTARQYPLQNILSEQQALTRQISRVAEEVTNWKVTVAGQTVECFLLPDHDATPIGFVAIFRADRAVCTKPTGPDELFGSMQQQDLKLKRNAALCRGKQSRCRRSCLRL
jgi:hypothetical protein